MDFYSNFLLLVYIIVVVFNLVKASNLVHKRFEYKYSFKPPYLAQKDGSVPFWEYGGSKYAFLVHVGSFMSLLRRTFISLFSLLHVYICNTYVCDCWLIRWIFWHVYNHKNRCSVDEFHVKYEWNCSSMLIKV